MPNEIKAVAGRVGGASTSLKKQEAARNNGRKGVRPAKKKFEWAQLRGGVLFLKAVKPTDISELRVDRGYEFFIRNGPRGLF